MISYSPAKINLGLFITSKRSDGYHNLQSIMVPLPFYDIIEILPHPGGPDGATFSTSGITIPGRTGENLCMKAFDLFNGLLNTGSCRIHLHKQIPPGSGLGGGSSNAVAVLRGLNQISGNHFTTDELHPVAASIGSDCAFFLHDGVMYAEGRGERLTPVDITLSGLHLVLISPGIHISSASAYRGIRPDASRSGLLALADSEPESWKSVLTNDFEAVLFRKHPRLKAIRDELYGLGAIYASMSGSGSAMYGLFRGDPGIGEICNLPLLWQGTI